MTLGSNGLLLDEHVCQEIVRLGVDRVVISLDGVSSDVYAGVRGVPIAGPMRHIRTLNETKVRLGSLVPALGIEFRRPEEQRGRGWPPSANWPRVLGHPASSSPMSFPYTEEMRDEVLYGYEPRPAF